MKKKMVRQLGVLLLLAGFLMFSVPVFAETVSYPSFIEECLTNEPQKAITKDFNLISSWEGAGVTWMSNNPSVIEIDAVNAKAVIHRPLNDTVVSLIATFDGTGTKTFNFTVLGSGTTVYMSDNFYYPTLSGTPIQNTSLAYNAGIGKYYGYSVTNTSGQYTMSIAANPGKANDYALKSNMANVSSTSGDTTMYVVQTPPTNGCVSVKAKIMSNSNANDTVIKADSGSAGTTLFAINVYAWANNIYLSNNSTTATLDAAHAVAIPATGTWFDVDILIDFTHGRYTVSVGGNSLTMSLANQPTANSLSRLSFSPYRNTASYLFVDDLVIAKSVIGGTDEEALDAYKNKLTFGSLTSEHSQYITKDINLDVLKQYSDAFGVTWSSSDTNALSITTSPTPKAVVHQTYKSQPVTLTATITHGGKTTTKSFDLTARALGESLTTYENFDDNTVDAAIPKSASSQGWVYVGSNTTVTDSIVADAKKGPVLRLDRNSTASGANGKIMRYFPWSGNPYGTRADGSFTSLACDLKFAQPEGITNDYILSLGTVNTTIADIDFVWQGDSLQVMYSDGTTLVPIANISGDAAPALGEWFRFEVKVNNLSDTSDFYINGKQINGRPIPFRIADTSNNTIYYAAFLIGGINADTHMYINDLGTTQSSNAWVQKDADLASAVIAANLQGLPAAGTKYSNSITWTVSGDATEIIGGNVTIPNGIGKGNAVLIGSVGSDVKRVFVIEFDKISPVMIQNALFKDSGGNTVNHLADGGTLESITVSASENGIGYIGSFENGVLKDVKKLDIVDGLNALNYALPASVANYEIKIFVWNGNMKPLSSVSSY